MPHEAMTLAYEIPPLKPRTRPVFVSSLLGFICLFLELVNELVTVVPSKAAEQQRWQTGYVLLLLAGLFLGFAVGQYLALRRSRRAA